MMSIFLTFYFVHIFKNASVIFKTLNGLGPSVMRDLPLAVHYSLERKTLQKLSFF